MSISPGRLVGVVAGSLAILGIGVYGPAMLLGPLPAAAVSIAPPTIGAPAGTSIALPAAGQSAVAVVGGTGEATVVATAGDPAAVPIGGAAKLVTVLAVLDSLPLVADQAGPSITIGPTDYTDYLRYRDEDSRVLQVSPGESWSERDVVRAVLLASSNNHADTLARWAFGSVGRYVDAANGWLAEHGFTATRVDDATGLSGDNVGTAEELARLVALALADPEVAGILQDGDQAPRDARRVPDVIDHLGELGVRTVTRSYTDPAALSYAFTADVRDDAGNTATVVGAMLLMPDYETLDPAVQAVLDGARTAVAPTALITAGDVYARAASEWGDEADIVAATTREASGWSAAGEATVEVSPFTTAGSGRQVGRVTVPTGGGDIASPLELAGSIDDPGPFWRLSHPFAIVGAYLAEQDAPAGE